MNMKEWKYSLSRDLPQIRWIQTKRRVSFIVFRRRLRFAWARTTLLTYRSDELCLAYLCVCIMFVHKCSCSVFPDHGELQSRATRRSLQRHRGRFERSVDQIEQRGRRHKKMLPFTSIMSLLFSWQLFNDIFLPKPRGTSQRHERVVGCRPLP